MHRLRQLSNQALLQRLRELVAREKRATAAVVLHLCEVERRGLHRDEGYSSLFAYCLHVLRLSESEAPDPQARRQARQQARQQVHPRRRETTGGTARSDALHLRQP